MRSLLVFGLAIIAFAVVIATAADAQTPSPTPGDTPVTERDADAISFPDAQSARVNPHPNIDR